MIKYYIYFILFYYNKYNYFILFILLWDERGKDRIMR